MVDTTLLICYNYSMTERQALIKIESLLERFLNRAGDPNEQLISDALGIAIRALESSKQNEQSWVASPDRMGGQFTEEEINSSGKWI